MDLKEALNDLEFLEKVVLMHHFWNGKKIEDIASILNREPDAVKKIQQRSLVKLRKSLGVYIKGVPK